MSMYTQALPTSFLVDCVSVKTLLLVTRLLKQFLSYLSVLESTAE